MSQLSALLEEATKPTSDFVRSQEAVYVVPPELVESTAEWMGLAIRQMQAVAPKHAAYLKKETGRGWKLFKHFLTENGRLIFRFDLARRQDMTQDPMVVLRMAYSAGVDHYNLQLEVWKSVGEQIGSYEIDDVDVGMLEDPERIYYRVEKALAQLKAKAKNEETMELTPGWGNGGWATLTEASGPAAERSTVLKQAQAGIEKMLIALETVRGWVKALNLGDKDKVGAAAAALKAAKGEISKAESIQSVLATIIDLSIQNPGSGWMEAIDRAGDLIVERSKAPSPDAQRAKEGLSRMLDGLAQLRGMLRQAKFSGRILDQIEAAIGGMKVTRDAIDALSESVKAVAIGGLRGADDYPPAGIFERFGRIKADQIRKGYWVRGGTDRDPIYRQVVSIERAQDDMAYVLFGFNKSYMGADGREHNQARFHKDAVLTGAKG